jgi:hypothetical protein
MSFEMEIVNGAEVANEIGKMIGHITYMGGVEMPKEMSNWQTGDVHRRRPATTRTRWRRGSTQSQTLFRPHSRYETERSTQYQKRLLRKLRRVGKTKRFKQVTDFIQLKRSNRPILRESLIEQLRNNMITALFETVSWK